jgi:MFS family permease
MWTWLRPKDDLGASEIEHGMRMLVRDAVFAQSMLVLTTGAFLVAFALLLGASNIVIGLLAAVGPIAQTLQIPAILLVEKARRRKVIAFVTITLSRLSVLGIAVLPWVVPVRIALPVFLVFLFLYFGLGAVGGCAFNSWFRDVVPVERINNVLTRRLTWATLAGAILSFAAAYGIDVYKAHFANPIGAYSVLFAVGCLAGLVSMYYLMRTPEPRMPSLGYANLRALLAEPLRDRNYRNFLVFLGSWNFAVNFAAPFFIVYMLVRLDLSMTAVLSLSLLGQIFNVLFFGIWGRLADRYSNKSVLLLSVPWFFFSYLLWPFTTLPERHLMTVPLLIIIHILSGIATAGVALSAGNLAYKSAPFGRAASYLAVNALVSGVAAALSPILAGFAAEAFAPYELRFALSWSRWQENLVHMNVPAIDLRGMDFLFIMAFVFGLYAIHRLMPIRENGEVSERVLRDAFFAETLQKARQVSAAAGLRPATAMLTIPLQHGAEAPAEAVER